MIKVRKLFFVVFTVFTATSSMQAQETHYLVEEAQAYFIQGRYWDAFFSFRGLQNQNYGDFSTEIKNSSRAMYLWKKTEDYRAFKNYPLAKSNLRELLILNPDDPNKGLLPRLSLEQAVAMQQSTLRQGLQEVVGERLRQALNLYREALDEGLKDEMVFSLIKQCELALEKYNYRGVQQPTSYGINYEKEKAREQKREVKIIQPDEEEGKPEEKKNDE